MGKRDVESELQELLVVVTFAPRSSDFLNVHFEKGSITFISQVLGRL